MPARLQPSRFLPSLLLAAWGSLLAGLLLMLVLGPQGLAGAPGPAPTPWGRVAQLAANSLLVAGGAAVASVLWSMPLALALHFLVGKKARLLIVGGAASALLVPPPVVAVAGVRLLSSTGLLTGLLPALMPAIKATTAEEATRLAPIFSLGGVAFCLWWAYWPIALLVIAAALRRVPSEALEAARLDAGPLRSILIAGSAALRGAALPAFAAVFLLSLVEFSIPESLRSQPVLVSEIYVQFGVYYDASAALRIAAALAAAAFVVLVALFLILPEAEEEAMPAETRALRGGGAVALAGAGAAAAALLPGLALVGILVMGLGEGPGGGVGVLGEMWAAAREEIYFTYPLAAAGALACLLTGGVLGAALAAMKRPLPGRLLLLAGFALPGPALGMALKLLTNMPPGPPLGALKDALAALDPTLAPLLLAWTLKFSPLVALLAEAALRRIPQELRDGQRLEASGFVPAFRTWAGAAITPAVIAGGFLSFALIIGEAGAAVLLIPPGNTTLSVRLLTLMHFAPTAQVNALCLLMITSILAVIPALLLIARMPNRSFQRATQ